MILRRDALFRAEAARFQLRMHCDECSRFDPDTERCAHRFPTEPHRRARMDDSEALHFCKEFELCDASAFRDSGRPSQPPDCGRPR